MITSIKSLWVNALRSGHYKQCRRRLHREDTYCCIGVLCEVIIQNNILPLTKTKDGYSPIEGSLHYDLLRQIELDTIAQQSLITLNDHHKENFDTIATYIENNL